jgi:putative transposase
MKQYQTDLTDSQWQVIKNIENDKRKRKHDLRELWNALLYIAKSGCQWRMMPINFPKWQLVYYYFRKWESYGIIENVHDTIHERVRVKMGKQASPSLGLMDSQSVKTSSMTIEKGYDGNKKVNGRKRHIITDTLGFLMGIVIHDANMNDREGAKLVLKNVQHKYPRLKKIIVDQGYTGELIDWTMRVFGWVLEVVVKVAGLSGFNVLPKRWVVERTFGWFNFQRRLSKDYELLPCCSEAMIRLSMIRIMLNKIPK